jgi:hypothetical protein
MTFTEACCEAVRGVSMKYDKYSDVPPKQRETPLSGIIETLYREHAYIASLLDNLEHQALKLKPEKIPDYQHDTASTPTARKSREPGYETSTKYTNVPIGPTLPEANALFADGLSRCPSRPVWQG